MNKWLRSVVLIICLLSIVAASAQCQRDRRQRFPDAGAASAAPAGPWLGTLLRDIPKDWKVQGALVYEVAVGSPADVAGIIAGDIITQFADKPIKASNDMAAVVGALAVGKTYTADILRGKQKYQVTITLAEKPTAGSPAPEPAVIRRASDINVLKYAVIDPETRVVTLIGKYDAAYHTGPIPYYDLLNDALTSPYPWFSLEPTKQTRADVEKVHKAIASDVERMAKDESYCTTYANRLMTLILTDPAFKQDKAQFVKRGAEAFKLTEDEMLKVLLKSANISNVSSEEMMPITGKMLVGMGYDLVGQALLGQHEGIEITCARLGILTEAQAIATKYQSGELSERDATIQAGVLIASAIMRGLRVPENEIETRANMVLKGRLTLDGFNKYMEQCMMDIVVDQVGLKMFNGLTLSHELLAKLYNIPAPQMELVFKDVSRESALGDFMYRADYALKTVCVSPDVRVKIPGFLTKHEYLHQEAEKQGLRIPDDVGVESGHRLVPASAAMRVNPSGTLVSFDEADVKIMGWLINEPSGKQATSDVVDFLHTATNSYADYLTQNYDQLARAYPAFHRLREATKIVALSRWAEQNNYSIVVDKALGIKLDQPATTNGFWQGIFTANKDEFSLAVITEGGASFGQDEGDAWVKPEVDAEFTSDVNKQLAYSTVFAKQAADAALEGDMEAARDLADKSARAMTGEIDFTQLPKLDIPMPTEPASVAALSSEGMAAIDESMRQIENAQVSIAKAAELESTSPAEAAQLKAAAEQQKQAGEAKLKALRDAMDEAMQDSGKIQQALVTIRDTSGGSPVITPIIAAAHSGTTGSTVTVKPTPGSAPVPAPKEITEAQKQKWLAELESLRNELDATKAQFAKLNASIQQDQQQFEDWEKEAEDGMERCSGFLYGLLMDASAGALLERYETMHELAKKLPDHPEDLIKKLDKTRSLLSDLGMAQTGKDVADLASRDAQTVPELLEFLRDGLTNILSVTGLDKTPPGALWKYGCGVVDMSYSFAQFCAAYDNIEQMDKNSDNYLKAVASLSERMKKLVTQINEVKGQLEASGVAVPGPNYTSGR